MSVGAVLSLEPRRLRAAAPPWQGVLEAADGKRARFEAALRFAVRLARDVFDPVEADKQLATHDERGLENNLLFSLAAETVALEAKVPEVVAATVAAGGEAAAKDVRRHGRFRVLRAPFDNLHFDLVNPEAVAWARERSGALITGITDAQRAAIRDVISRSFTEGLTTAESGRFIRELVGLTPAQANAVLNLRRKMLEFPGRKLWAGSMPVRVPKGGASWDFIFRRGEQYAQRLLNARAHVIARTETIAASNFGQLSLWRQAVDKGLILGTDEKRWIVTPDDRLCPICEGMSGEQVPLREPFSIGVDAPPAHANCRCTMGLARPRGGRARPTRGQPVKNPLLGFDPTASKSITDLIGDMRGRLGIGPDVVVSLNSSAVESVGAFGFYDPRTKLIGLSRRVSDGLVEAMFGQRSETAWNAVRSVAHEAQHARSLVMQAVANGEKLPDWFMYWEEAVAEHRARLAATDLLFGGREVPNWVAGASRSYVDEVRRLKILSDRGLDLERFYSSSARERLAAINEIARDEATSILTSKGFKNAEIRTIIDKLGDDAQHLVRLNKVTPGGWGAMTRRQILKELREDWEVVL